MLTKILSVSGKPGLYRLVSTAKNLNIVESLLDGKKTPVYMTEKMIALSDVSIYTTENDVPLREIFQKIKEKEKAGKVALGSKSSNKEIFEYFGEVLPNFDTDKVYASDIKKMINWYNILIDNDIDFEKEEEKTKGKPDEKEVEIDSETNKK